MRNLIGHKKLGRNALLKRKTYATFGGEEGHPEPHADEMKRLPGLCADLLSEQKRVWPDLRIGCESLMDVRERDLFCKTFSVRLQYNPGRIKSSTADVDKNTPMERQCFLCPDRLPNGQKGVLYRDSYLILCNPMPVFPSHFIVSHLDHRSQAIVEYVGTLLQLMADFGNGWMVLYNGPRCGASAPDHLHFHVIPSGQVPIEKEIREERRLILMKQMDDVLLYRVKDLGREVLILEGEDPMAVGRLFMVFLGALKKLLLIDEEPMINVAGFYENSRWKERKWYLLIFPRQKHRPGLFFREGDARVVVSPGVIDMGGLVITPVEKDFERLNGAAVESIYREVSLERKIVKRAIDEMK